MLFCPLGLRLEALGDDPLTNQPSLNGQNVIRVRWPKLLFGQPLP